MNGGLIRDCKADDDGGAVYLGANCVFTMNGETIQNCSANDEGGAVIVKSKATFSMHGDAKIENCKAELGGGVHVKSSGNFTMSGGAISDRTAKVAGNALYVYPGDPEDKAGIFSMSANATIDGSVSGAYTVTFDSDGGSAVPPQFCANAPATKPGYIFAGWDKDIPATMPRI